MLVLVEIHVSKCVCVCVRPKQKKKIFFIISQKELYFILTISKKKEQSRISLLYIFLRKNYIFLSNPIPIRLSTSFFNPRVSFQLLVVSSHFFCLNFMFFFRKNNKIFFSIYIKQYDTV